MTRVPVVTSRALAHRRLAAARDPAAPRARKYLAARPDRLAGGFSPFGVMASARVQVRQDLRGLVAHARYGARNLDYLRAFEMMVRRNVVGPRGIRLQVRVRTPAGEVDGEAARRIESAWSEWGERGTCTTCGRLSWWNLERIAATMIAREGNFLGRLHIGRAFGPFAFQVEVLPLDVLDLDLVQTLPGGGYIDGGVEFDANGRPAALHIWTHHPGEHHTGRPTRRLRLPMAEVIHVYDPTEPLQALGVPASHTALRRLNMIGRYEEAALTAAHYGAAAMAWIKRAPDAEGPPDAEAESALLPEEIEAGMVAELPPGADLAGWTPNYPDGEMSGFVAHMLRGGAAGLGVSYSGLANDLTGANFSSLRAGLGEEREQWRDAQRVLYEGLHDRVFRAWIGPAILSGRLRLPASGLDRFAASATWRPRGWAAVNPKDDAAAADADLRNRLRAPSAIVAERGEDFGDVAERFAMDLETLRAAGVPLPEALTPKAAVAPPSPKSGDLEDPEAKE